MLSVGVVGLVIVLLIVLLVSGGGTSKNASGTSKGAAVKSHVTHSSHRGAAVATGGSTTSQLALVALSLTPTAEVYVCLIGDNGRKLIPGTLLAPGASTPTYRARRFEMTLGNNALTMNIDGRARRVPASTQAIGYSLTKANGRRRLLAGELPTCK
jgi:hypothetical protein